MPKWLTKAKAAFKTPEPVPPEPFRLVCVCGGIINGIRGEHEQRVRCGDCHHEMFVLPESVYPPPKVRYRGAIEVIEDEVEIVEESPSASDELPPGPADAIMIAPEKLVRKPRGKRNRKRGRKEDPSDPDTKRSTGKSSSANAAKVAKVRGIRPLRNWQFKVFTPFRAIAAGILLALLLTGYVVIHSRNVANAEVVRIQSGKLGEEALDEGNLATAIEELTKVDDALRTLGSDDARSRQLHQLFLEVRAATDLIPTTVPDMLASAVDTSGPTAITSWEDNFNLTYRDKWVVIDTTVRSDNPAAEVRIPVPALLEKNSATFVIAGESFAGRLAAGGEQRVVFGGRVESCGAKGTKHKTWEIRFAADSFFLWTDPRTYELLGFSLDEEATEVLRQQAEMLGVAR